MREGRDAKRWRWDDNDRDDEMRRHERDMRRRRESTP